MIKLLLAIIVSSSAQGPATPPSGSVGTAAIVNGAVTAAKLASGAAASNIGYTPAHSGANSDITSITGLSTPLAVGQGGTGSATQNFVDLTTAQSSIGGVKTFTAKPVFSAGLSSNTGNISLSSGIIELTGGSQSLTFGTTSINTIGFGVFNTKSLTMSSGFGDVFLNFDTTTTGTPRLWTGPHTNFYESAATGITAAGTNQATCTQLTEQYSNVTTVASGTGVCLPPTNLGAHFLVHTSGANSLLIYANPAGGTLNGQGATAGITLANSGGSTPGTRVIDCYSTTLCFSGASIPDAN